MRKLLLTTAALTLGATLYTADAKAAPACDANVSQAGQVCITGMTQVLNSGGCVYVSTTYAPWGWAAVDLTGLFTSTAVSSTPLATFINANAGINQLVSALDQSRVQGHGIGLTVVNPNGHCGGAYIITSVVTQ